MSMKRFITAAAVAAVAGGGLLLASAPAFATNGQLPAPWEPDPTAIGSVLFFNSAGQPVTQGTDYTNAFAYAEASNNSGTTGTKAAISWAFPDPASPLTSWFVKAGFAATNYPNAAAPAPLNSASNPLFAVGSSGASNISVIKGAGVNSSTAGYNSVLQVRMTSAGGLGGSTADSDYWASDIAYNSTTGAWTEIASDSQIITHTALVASPTSGPAGTSVTLTATETVEATTTGGVTSSTPVAGSVQFYDGTTAIGTAQAVAGGASNTATFTTSSLSVANHNLAAVFTPTNLTAAQPSTGFATENVSGPSTNTALSIPGTVYATDSQGSYPASLDATVTFAIGGGGVTAGSVAFFDGSTQIASVPAPGAAGGVYDTTYNFATTGNHNITAVFTPTDPTAAAPSTSQVVTVNVLNKPHGACSNEANSTPNCTDTQSIEAGIPTGTITITTPYNGTSCTGAAATTNLPNIGTTETIAGGTTPNQNSLTPSTPGCVNGVLNIGTLGLTSDDREFSAFTTFQDIAITDNLSANQNWTLSAQASNLHDSNYSCTPVPPATTCTPTATSSNTINGQNVGLTSLMENTAAEGANHYVFTTTGGAITKTDAPVPTTAVAFNDPGALGLGGTAKTLLSSTPGLGSYVADGTITLVAPTTTEAGLFTGTITFTLATS